MLRVTCACGKGLTTAEKNAGRKAKCPNCGAAVTFPGPGPGEAAVFIPAPQTQAKATVSGIMARLEGLEASDARMKSWCRWSLGGATLALVAAGGSMMTHAGRESPRIVVREQPRPVAAEVKPPRPGVIEASSFLLRDDAGNMKGMFRVQDGKVGLFMYDGSGAETIRLGMEPDGRAVLAIGNPDPNKPDASGILLARSPSGTSGIFLEGRFKQRYAIFVPSDGDPQTIKTGMDGEASP